MEPAPFETLDLVADLLRQAEREKRAWKVRQSIAFAFSLNYLASIEIKYLLPEPFRTIYQFASLVLFCFGASLSLGILTRPTRRQQRIALQIANCRAPGVTGALVETCRILQQSASAGDLRKAVGDALAERLPSVTAEEGDSWTAAQRSALREVLKSTISVSILARDVTALRDKSMKVSDPKLALAVLAAIERIGGQDDVKPVALLAKADTKDMDGQTVRAAARRCLEALEERIETRRKSETLLRPSESVEEQLLRAASPSGAREECQTLLRPDS